MSNKQHTPEPFGFFRAEPFGWTDCAETDEGAKPLFDQAAIDAISKQRDELLAAIELCIPELRGWMNSHGEDIGTIAAIKAGKAAIASVKEKK